MDEKFNTLNCCEKELSEIKEIYKNKKDPWVELYFRLKEVIQTLENLSKDFKDEYWFSKMNGEKINGQQ